MKELVFKVYWGGLGDHLLYTPVPRLAKQLGYDKVYVSNHSAYRNPDTQRLVWMYNPYVDGFTDVDTDYPKFATVESGLNILDQIARFCGLPDDGVRYREPEIYYKPKVLPWLSGAMIFEPNSINKSGVPTIAATKTYFRKQGITITHQMQSIYDAIDTKNSAVLAATNLEHFCDIIVSCQQFYCFTTGAATLAAALGKPATVLYTPGIKPMFHHSKLHTYINIGDCDA